MRFYTQKPQFDRDTGNLVAPKLVATGYLCDYTGLFIPTEDSHTHLVYSVTFKDTGGSEEYWYYDTHTIINRLANELKCDKYAIRHHLNTTPFHFIVQEDTGSHDASGLLVEEWAANLNTSGHLFEGCYNLPTACALARYRMIERLLNEGAIHSHNLGIVVDNYNDVSVCSDPEDEL